MYVLYIHVRYVQPFLYIHIFYNFIVYMYHMYSPAIVRVVCVQAYRYRYTPQYEGTQYEKGVQIQILFLTKTTARPRATTTI